MTGQTELPLDDPRDLSGRLAHPRFEVVRGPSTVNYRTPEISLEFQMEFLFEACEGEGMSWGGASAIYIRQGNWCVIAPGVPTDVVYLGSIRALAIYQFASLVVSLTPQRLAALALYDSGN